MLYAEHMCQLVVAVAEGDIHQEQCYAQAFPSYHAQYSAYILQPEEASTMKKSFLTAMLASTISCCRRSCTPAALATAGRCCHAAARPCRLCRCDG